MRKIKTFDQAKQEIELKYNYLTLLEFSTNNSLAKFLDIDFGEFSGNYKTVFRGNKNHPERSKINKLKKFEETNIKKYGFKNPFQSKEVKLKSRQTMMKNFGYEYNSQVPELKLLRIEKCLEQHGVEFISQTNNWKNKFKQSCFDKYQVDNPFKYKPIKEKQKQSLLDIYNVENSFQIKEVIEKIKEIYYSKSIEEKQLIQNKKYNSKLKNGIYKNINGESLKEFHLNSNLDISYSNLTINYKLYGDKALEENFYNHLAGKSSVANHWISSIENRLNYNLFREFQIPNTNYYADAFDLNTNTIYEFYGDFWHGNLNKFNPNDFNPILNKSYQELFDKTILREIKIKEFGFNIVSIWEADYIKTIKENIFPTI